LKEKTLQVLLVEDNAGDARLLREMFSKEKVDSFELTHLLRMSEAVEHLEKGGVDIVLLDMGLPDGHGLETVRRARAAAPTVPLIILTGLDDEALAANAMKEGAQDYLIKGQIENRALPRVLRHAIERHRMQTETDALLAHQMQFKDEFLSHVSHELRSPLTAIYQFVTILSDRLAGELNSEQLEYLGIIHKNVKQLQSMINDLLEVTGVQAGKLTIELQCTSASEAIAYAINTLQGAAAAKEITLSSDLEGLLPALCADPMRLRQILIILIDNAIKFTPAHGLVQIMARIQEGNPNLLELKIIDSGCGISPDMTERIFERLFQTSDPSVAGRKGLGLGLYICKELLVRQGGEIWAKSELGQGSIFTLTLPVFSLSSLIAPALGKKGLPNRSITVVTTEIGSLTGWLSDEVRSEQSHVVRTLLQRCLHSDFDVLLPKMGSAGAVELFFIVAVTDAIGGEAISNRIREQLNSCEQIQEAGLLLAISHKTLVAARRKTNETVKDFLENTATDIRELVNQEISERMAANEQ